VPGTTMDSLRHLIHPLARLSFWGGRGGPGHFTVTLTLMPYSLIVQIKWLTPRDLVVLQLCRRAFESFDQLRKHEAKSKLHAVRLLIRASSVVPT
jgi:hypothetical protein